MDFRSDVHAGLPSGSWPNNPSKGLRDSNLEIHPRSVSRSLVRPKSPSPFSLPGVCGRSSSSSLRRTAPPQAVSGGLPPPKQSVEDCPPPTHSSLRRTAPPPAGVLLWILPEQEVQALFELAMLEPLGEHTGRVPAYLTAGTPSGYCINAYDHPALWAKCLRMSMRSRPP
jgi:hypothetical protein